MINSTEIIMIFSIIMNFSQAILFLTMIYLVMRKIQQEETKGVLR